MGMISQGLYQLVWWLEMGFATNDEKPDSHWLKQRASVRVQTAALTAAHWELLWCKGPGFVFACRMPMLEGCSVTVIKREKRAMQSLLSTKARSLCKPQD